MIGFYGRLSRLGYFIRLCMIAVMYGLGGLLVSAGSPEQSLNLLKLICLFMGSGLLLLAFLSWWFSTARRLHDMDFSGWWFLLVCVFPVAVLVLCLWPGSRGYNRFGGPLLR